MAIRDDLMFQIRKWPGRTEAELARNIFGQSGYQQRVNSDCKLLVSQKLIARRGFGGPSDPYRYYPTVNRIPGDRARVQLRRRIVHGRLGNDCH